MPNTPDKITIHTRIVLFLSALLDTPLKAFIFELGVLSHYVADLHQPFHTDGKYRFADEETAHKIMEADTRLHLNDFQIKLEIRRRIKDPIGYFTYQIYEINGFYDTLIENYFLKKGKVKPDRWQNSFPIIEECITLAVQNIANVFLSFEIATKIFQHLFRNSKLRKNIVNLIDLNKYYKLIEYSSGTISLRRSHVC